MKTSTAPNKTKSSNQKESPNWDEIRALFNYNPEYIHLATSQFLVSHPKPVTEAIEYYRSHLDANPVLFIQENEDKRLERSRRIAAKYLGVDEPENIALTGNTTAGLGMVYTGLNLGQEQEVLTTEHDHYSHHESIRQATLRTGGYYKKVKLYEDIANVSAEEITSNLINAISDKTSVIGITWVHSSNGLKLPIRQISNEIKAINELRDEEQKIILLVDGVHGFGIETETFTDLGCDIFIAGCHKWLYGPRGTGLIAATTDAWQDITPVIPSFTDVMDLVIEDKPRPNKMDGKQMTPGGFQSFENRWALYDAFDLMLKIGKENIKQRVHSFAKMCKEGLAAMPHVKLHTPMDEDLSSGIVSFEIDGYEIEDAVKILVKKKIIATSAPYQRSYVRLTPGIINTEEEINTALNIIDGLKKK